MEKEIDLRGTMIMINEIYNLENNKKNVVRITAW
jgi:hypothetical protein